MKQLGGQNFADGGISSVPDTVQQTLLANNETMKSLTFPPGCPREAENNAVCGSCCAFFFVDVDVNVEGSEWR